MRRVAGAAILIGVLGTAVACSDDRASPDTALTPAGQHGYEVARDNGCFACHGDGGMNGVAATWKGLYGSQVALGDGTSVTADEAYLTESITAPSAKISAGATLAMPANRLDAEQIAAVIDYIEELR